MNESPFVSKTLPTSFTHEVLLSYICKKKINHAFSIVRETWSPFGYWNTQIVGGGWSVYLDLVTLCSSFVFFPVS
jgi:hypothetical protein